MDKELTTEQKLEVIKLSKTKLFNYSNYLCPCISNSIRELGLGINQIDPEEYVPEFLKFKPKITWKGCIWFSIDNEGNEKREKVLNILIKVLTDKLDNERKIKILTDKLNDTKKRRLRS